MKVHLINPSALAFGVGQPIPFAGRPDAEDLIRATSVLRQMAEEAALLAGNDAAVFIHNGDGGNIQPSFQHVVHTYPVQYREGEQSGRA